MPGKRAKYNENPDGGIDIFDEDIPMDEKSKEDESSSSSSAIVPQKNYELKYVQMTQNDVVALRDQVKPSSFYKTLRRFNQRQAQGKTTKTMDPTSRLLLKDRMKNLSDLRKPVIQKYMKEGRTFARSEQASRDWLNFVRNSKNVEGFGIDAQGIAKRRALAEDGFNASSGLGKFKNFYISSGVLRGGLTARGKQVGANGYAIPIRPAGEKRILQSVLAKYTNPLAFPTTRVIKFIRGHWGNQGSSDNELVW